MNHSNDYGRHKRWALRILGLLVVGFVAGGCSQRKQEPTVDNTPPSPPPDPARILATVQKQPIRQADLNLEAARVAAQSRIPRNLAPEQQEQVRQQIIQQAMNNLVVRALLLDAADREQIGAPARDINERREALEAQLPPGTTLDAYLEQQGLNQQMLREALTAEIKIERLLNKHAPTPKDPTEDKIQAFYLSNQKDLQLPEQVAIQHISLMFAPGDGKSEKRAKRKKAESLRKQLVKGADFGALAAQHSDDPSKTQGGHLPPFSRGQMLPEIEAVAFTLATNTISPVIESPLGVHILRVLQREPPRLPTYEESRASIAQYLVTQEHQQQVQKYVESLRQAAEIKVVPENAEP